MVAPKIRVDYDGLAQIAKIFARHAEQTRATLKRLSSKFETLDGGDWVGKGAQKFSSEMRSSVLPSVQGLSEVFDESSQVTNKIVDLMHQSDEEIARLFQPMVDGPIAAAPSAGAAGAEAGAGAGAAAAAKAKVARDKAVDTVLKNIDPKVRELVKKSPTLSAQVASLNGKVTYKMGPKGSTKTYFDPKTNQIIIGPAESLNAQVSSIAHETGHAKYKAPYHAPVKGMTKTEYIQKNVREQMLDEGNAQFNAAVVRDEVKKAGGPTLKIPGTQGSKYLSAYNDYKAGKITKQQAVSKMADLMANEKTSVDNKPYKQYYGKTYEDYWNKHIGKGKTKI
ncbi:MAG: WXG100 family type VII secretion target [Anaerolineales bacterium]|jgi:WXG100 family type VII secretion target